jgi:putative membrane protein
MRVTTRERGKAAPVMWGWHSWWHWLSMAGVWIVVLGVAVWSVARLFPAAGTQPGPRELLDERLARGEIDAEQYRLLRSELERR